MEVGSKTDDRQQTFATFVLSYGQQCLTECFPCEVAKYL